jgi:hypothetical protein
MESLQLALQVEVSLLPEPPGIALVITHVPFIEEATVETTEVDPVVRTT